MQKQKKDIVDIVTSLFNYKTLSVGYKILKAVIILYFGILFSIFFFNFIRIQTNLKYIDLYVYIYIMAFALYSSFIYFLMVKASKEFLVGLILLVYFNINLLFINIQYKGIISIISLLVFLYYIISIRWRK